MIRFHTWVLGAIGTLVVACGQVAPEDRSTTSIGGSSSGSSTGTAPDAIIGELDVTTETFQGGLLEGFAANLQPYPSSVTTFTCPGATVAVGSCCAFPPSPPPPTLIAGSGTGTGTGAVDYGGNAGVLALVDTTSLVDIGTFSFGAEGYAGLPANYYATRWQPGDTLTLSASGDQIGAFTLSAPALSPPAVHFPTSFATSEGMTVTWQPDPNADTIMITIQDRGMVVCSAPSSDGSITLDASLFTGEWSSGDQCEGSAVSDAVRFAQTPAGRVMLDSAGYSGSIDVDVK